MTFATDMIEVGKGAKHPAKSVMMSRYACYLVIQNADPSKEIQVSRLVERCNNYEQKSKPLESGWEIWQSLFTGGSLCIPGDYMKFIDAQITLDRSGRQAWLGESQRDLRIVLKADQGLVCFRG